MRQARISVRDSNFIFGTVMTGQAELRVDGHPVRVEPNGAFLAWLPVPEPAGQDAAEYLLVARGPAGADTLRHRIRLPPEPFEGKAGTVWVDASSLPPEVERWLLPTDPIPFAVRAAPGLAVAVEAEDIVSRLREVTPGVYEGSVDVVGVLKERCAERRGAGSACSGPDQLHELEIRLSATDGRRSVRENRSYPIAVLDPAALPVVELHDEPDPVHGRADVVVARPTPYGTYRWLFPERSRGIVDQRIGDRVRLRLSSELGVWLAEEDTEVIGESGGRVASVGSIRAERRSAGVTAVAVPLDRAVPVHVEETEEGGLKLILHGALGETEGMLYRASEGSDGGDLESLTWTQKPGVVFEVMIRPRRPIWGHRLSYVMAGEGESELLLEIRSPPVVDPDAPLRGRRIAVDAGHPPVGAFGPTGLYEGDANLAIARRLVSLLEAQGAEPIMLRRDTLPLGLYDRTGSAIEADAELFVSIHNNALPDGVRPFGEEGTSTYYFHPHSRKLANAVQSGLVSTMGLRDLGTRRGSFAVVRMPWMPSVLAEGAFMMFPLHEAALRTPMFQEAYARGVLEGIRSFLSQFAG
jgi:N-acetylmuramoyl-L-alanine amidase